MTRMKKQRDKKGKFTTNEVKSFRISLTKSENDIIQRIRKNNDNFLKIPKDLIIYKIQNRKKPNKLVTEFSIEKYNGWMLEYEDMTDLFSELFHSEEYQHFYNIISENEKIIDNKLIIDKISEFREQISHSNQEVAHRMADNEDALKYGYEPPHVSRNLDNSQEIKEIKSKISVLKSIRQLNNYNIEKEKQLVDWKRTALNIFRFYNEANKSILKKYDKAWHI